MSGRGEAEEFREPESQRWVKSLGYNEQDVHGSGKRCGLVWDPWMGDWFTSHSPRNGNSNAEGYWDHWVDLAIQILRDPLTQIVRPDAHAAVVGIEPLDLYNGVNRQLTDDELMARFRIETS